MRALTVILRTFEVLIVVPPFMAALHAMATGGNWELYLGESLIWFLLIEGVIRFLRRNLASDSLPKNYATDSIGTDDDPEGTGYYESLGEAMANGASVQVTGKHGGPGIYV